MPAFGVLGVLALVVFFVVLARHANQVFLLSVREGRALLIQGRIPAGLQGELLEVLRRAEVRDATVRVVRESGRARLLASGSGIDASVLQRLRNVLGTRTWRDLKLASPPARRNLGQRLGWSWLAWRIEDARRSDERAA